MNLKIEQTKTGNICLVDLSGEIDVYTADKLSKAILPLTEKATNNVEIDLEKITYLDSTGLGAFISAYKSAKKHGSSLKLINTKERVLRLFQITGLDEIIDISVKAEESEIID